jgi:NAD(P)H-hydrate epimerase
MSYSYYDPEFSELVPHRREDVHKGECGRVGVFAGSLSMMGAAVFSTMSAFRMGAGLVYLMTVPEALPSFSIMYPEVIVLPVDSQNGVATAASSKVVLDKVLAHRMDVVAIGPGLGEETGTKEAVRKILVSMNGITKVVLDADGINAVSVADIKRCPSDMILTPHLGEFERLFGVPSGADLKSRETAVVAAANVTGKVVVLKGHNTIVSDGKSVYVNVSGNAGMATAGAGDVLTGVIASLLAQGVGVLDSAVLGVYLHGFAGDLAFDECGVGLIASDIIELLPEALLYLSDEDEDQDDHSDGELGGMHPHDFN